MSDHVKPDDEMFLVAYPYFNVNAQALDRPQSPSFCRPKLGFSIDQMLVSVNQMLVLVGQIQGFGLPKSPSFCSTKWVLVDQEEQGL
ncbi:hypothetical protein AXF42_Ash021402 [Apostasia shenzhenica]|uniref:Uncharacterized protein n=1 Tax=Apostasia shenzhenica TaxID=1088818 RepID=A0A2H9ZZJ9_9ASPA|nr:hypothetical protein AXF42_Ash021402 [Apostasia shenzhenica]